MVPIQARTARTLLGLSRSEVAVGSSTPLSRVIQFETGALIRADVGAAMERYYSGHGVEFINEPGRVGVALRQPTLITAPKPTSVEA